MKKKKQKKITKKGQNNMENAITTFYGGLIIFNSRLQITNVKQNEPVIGIKKYFLKFIKSCNKFNINLI